MKKPVTSLSKVLYSAASLPAVAAFIAGQFAIWNSDDRWWQTCSALAAACFVIVAAGVFVNIHEDFS